MTRNAESEYSSRLLIESAYCLRNGAAAKQFLRAAQQKDNCMKNDLPDVEYQRFWKRLQQIGLNAYESRSYLVLVGHPKFKALELAARAHVPRQKIYEVLDSLGEKGFAQVVQEKTKLFSAVEADPAISGYLSRGRQSVGPQRTGQERVAPGLVGDLER